MTTYTVIRIYKIEAGSISQATRRLLEAEDANKAENFLVSETVRETDDPADKPAGIGTIVKRQLTGSK